MNISFDFERQAGVVEISGNLNVSNADNLKKQFLENLNRTKNFILDLKKMDFVDSTGLGAIVACLKYAVEQEGMLKIANLQKKPKMLFEITRVYKVFDIYDSLEEAIKSFEN
jgi:anti-sigma B factor antagonist